MSVFVFGYDEVEDIKYPTYRSNENYPDTLALLRITENGTGMGHYVYTKNTKAFFTDLIKSDSFVYISIY